MLNVSEVFYSLQGEGRYTGRPSVFVRFGGCNLRCEGFGGACDSAYAVDVAYKSSWMKYDAAGLIAEFERKKLFAHVDTVLTGGEPTLWFGNPDFIRFAEYLSGSGSLVTVETNGTKSIDFGFEPYRNFVFALSVKLSNSGEAYKGRINKEALELFVKNAKYFFKFVLDADFISSGLAKKEIDEIKNEFGIDPADIYCMPLGASKEQLLANAKSVFEFSAAEGYSYSDRVHIRVFDKKRGV